MLLCSKIEPSQYLQDMLSFLKNIHSIIKGVHKDLNREICNKIYNLYTKYFKILAGICTRIIIYIMYMESILRIGRRHFESLGPISIIDLSHN